MASWRNISLAAARTAPFTGATAPTGRRPRPVVLQAPPSGNAGRWAGRGGACRAQSRGGARNSGRAGGSGAPTTSQGTNYYDLLGVPTSADGDEIKSEYRRLQKAYHPDKSGDQFTEMSVDLNEAFDTLKDPEKRKEYDHLLKAENNGRMPDAGLVRSKDGLVGPIRGGRVLLQAKFDPTVEEQEEAEEVSGKDTLVLWVREWSKTLAFAAGMPLPLSLQADFVPDGARLSFVGVYDGAVQTAAALEILVLPRKVENNSQADEMDNVLQQEPLWDVQVRRITFGREPSTSAVATEERVMKAFGAALRGRHKRAAARRKAGSNFGFSGVMAALTQGFIGGIPILGSDVSESGGLEAYHLKRNPRHIDSESGHF